LVSVGRAHPRWKRLSTGFRELNRNPALVRSARRARVLTMGDDGVDDRFSMPQGRTIDVAFRQLAALRTEEPGVVGEVGATVLQGWQRLAESQGRGRGEVDLAVLFTDLVGFSTWALEAGDELAIGLLREVSNAIEPPILSRRGEIVKRLGDGLMGAFRDADSAAHAAFEGCERVASIEVDGYTPCLRTGIHLGRPRKVGRDYFGVDVNIAARLAEAAEPGEILVSGRTLNGLDPTRVTASERLFRAKGTPDDLGAHVLQRV
jgi:adenylate cyclase